MDDENKIKLLASGWDSFENSALLPHDTEEYQKALSFSKLRFDVLKKFDVVNTSQLDKILDKKLKKEFEDLIIYFNNLNLKK